MSAAGVAGSSLAHVTVGQVMSAPVITVRADSPTQQVVDTLARHRISAVPVVDGQDALLGVVSEYDLLARDGAVARDLMTTAVISVGVDTPLDDVRHLLIERRIRRVPVVHEGRVVGIVSRHDVVTMMATEWACQVCGEPVPGESRPNACPKCQAAGEQFLLQERPPGA